MVEIIEVTPENVSEKGVCCVIDRKSPGFKAKVNWFRSEHNKDVRIKMAIDENGKRIGFIEYLPSEAAWRPVKARNYLFVQCIAVYVKDFRSIGIGSILLSEAEKDATNQNKDGLFAIASNGAWMANKTLFEKNGFELVASKGRYDLLVKAFTDGPKPVFIDWEKNLDRIKGWHLIYSDQCPWHEKAVKDLQDTAVEFRIELQITKLNSPDQAQSAPSGFGTFSLVHDGKLLEDHYISATRFRSIIKQVLQNSKSM